MGKFEDENERLSQGMVDGQRPVRYWRRGISAAEMSARLDAVERRIGDLERRLG